MKKRFIVSHNPGVPTQDEAFKAWLNTQEVAWWHWLVGTWLVVDPIGKLTLEKLRSEFMSAYPGVHCLVFELLGPDNWLGFGPATPPKDMGDWLKKAWRQN